VDTYCALLSAFAILAAHTQRQADPQRRGQVIDVSMLDATMVMMSSVMGTLMISGQQPERTGNRGFSRAPTADTFDTSDGAITIGAVQQGQVERLFRAMGRMDLLDDPRFATPDARMQNDAALQTVLRGLFAERTALEWEHVLATAGVPAGMVRDAEQALALEQLAGRDLFQDVPTPNAAVPTARTLNAGFRFAHDGPAVSGPPPTVGQHTDEVLSALRGSADAGAIDTNRKSSLSEP
jgi:crotonobetainyl-CoA:carnitine CoA-transferase CaiB-like acyl-CoA transferase